MPFQGHSRKGEKLPLTHLMQEVPKEGSFSLSHLLGKVGDHHRCLSRILPFQGYGGVHMEGQKLAHLVQEVSEQGSFSLSHLLGKVGDHDSAGCPAPPSPQEGHDAVRQLPGLAQLRINCFSGATSASAVSRRPHEHVRGKGSVCECE